MRGFSDIALTAIVALLIGAGFVPSAFASEIDGYLAEVRALRADLGRYANASPDELLPLENRIGERLKSINRKISFEGTVVETDNRELSALFDAARRSAAERPERTRQMIERLQAIEKKIEEAVAASESRTGKDENKQKLSEILKREEFRKPEPPEESLAESIWKKIEEWLNQQFPRPEMPTGISRGLQPVSFVLQMLLYAVVIGVTAYLLYRFIPFLAKRFGGGKTDEDTERVILGERLADDADSTTLFGEAERLAREGNLRGAIRKGYIAVLCELSDRRLIGLARHKTNRDYLRDLRKDRSLYANVNGLTNTFERHWYGLEDARTEDWEAFRENYRTTLGDR